MMRPTLRFALLVLLAAPVACKFTFDRELPPGEIRGTVQAQRSGDGAQVGLAGARVRLLGTPLLANSGPGGAFALRKVPSGTHTVTVGIDANGDGSYDSQLRLPNIEMTPVTGANDPRNARDLGKILLEPAGSVSGRLSYGGHPAAGVAVAIKGQPQIFARTAPDGSFHFPYLAPGHVDLVVLRPGPEQIAAADLGGADVRSHQDSRVDAALPDGSPGGHVRVRVVPEDRVLLKADDFATMTVELLDAKGAALKLDPVGDQTFEADVPVGTYSLHVAPGLNLSEVRMGGLSAYPGAEAISVFLFDESQGADTDGDGILDEKDPDDDNDGVPDEQDGWNGNRACALDPDGHADSDHDGLCDTVDVDADDDKVANAFDNCPLVQNDSQADQDDDGVGDACDNCPTTPNPGQEASGADKTKGDACSGGPATCSANNGGCDPSAQCIEQAGAILCSCKPGDVGNGQTGGALVCSAPGGCSVDNGGCDLYAACSGSGTQVKCACPGGWVGDGTSCHPPGYSVFDRQPAPRRGARAVYDPKRKQIFVVGGSAGAEVWALSPETHRWRALLTDENAAPAAVDQVRVLADSAGDRLIVLTPNREDSPGGFQLWQLELGRTPARWTRLAPQGVLPSASLDLDPSTFTAALVDGGAGPVLVVADTMGGLAWRLPLAGALTWEQVEVDTANAPSSSGMEVVADAARQQLVFVDREVPEKGIGQPALWTLSMAQTPWKWADHTAQLGNEPGRLHHRVVGLDADHALIVGGQAADGSLPDPMVLDLSTLQTSPAKPGGTAPSGRLDAAAAWDPAGKQLLYFGGYVPPSQGPDGQVLSDLWTLHQDASSWTWSQLIAGTWGPGARSGASLVYDEADDQVVLFGGLSANTGSLVDSVGVMSLASKREWMPPPAISSLTSLPPVRDHGAIWDPVAKRMVVFGGLTTSVVAGGLFESAGLYQLTTTGGSWVWNNLLTNTATPAARAFPAAVYDPANKRMCLVGGTNASNPVDTNVWLLPLGPAGSRVDPAAWSQVTIQNGPTTTDASSIYDPNPAGSPRLVTFYGTEPTPAAYTFTLNGQSSSGKFTSLDASFFPPLRQHAKSVYDAAHKRLLVLGGQTDAGWDVVVWALSLEGTPTWNLLCPKGPQAIRAGSALVATSHGILVHGGDGAGDATYLLDYEMPACPTQ